MPSPNVVTGDVIVLTLYTQCRTQVAMNVLHYKCGTSAGAGGSVLGCATILGGALSTTLLPLIGTSATFRGSSARIVSPLAHRSKTYYSNNGNGAGTDAAAILSLQTCGLIKKVADVPARRGVGHVYVPFPTSTFDTADGKPNPTYRTLLTAFCAALQLPRTVGVGADTSYMIPCLFGHGPGEDPFATLIDAHLPQDYWATQDRRSDYGRTNISPI